MNKSATLNIVYGIDGTIESTVHLIVKDRGYTYPHPFKERVETDVPADELVEIYKEVSKEVLDKAKARNKLYDMKSPLIYGTQG